MSQDDVLDFVLDFGSVLGGAILGGVLIFWAFVCLVTLL